MRRGGARTLSALMTAAALLGAGASCKHSSDYLWIDEVPPSTNRPDDTYLIRPGDVISVRVWNQEANSVDRARVREDGKISVPFLNDIDVAGQAPAELAQRIQVKLKTFIVNPVVTVMFVERPPLRVSVLGEVTHPGTYDLEHGAGVLHALAAAGGMTPFASSDGIFVLRRGYWADGNPAPARIRFRWSSLRAGKAPASIFRLRSGDVVVVE